MEAISRQLARCEIGWWKAHHRRDKKKLYTNLIEKHSLLFGVPTPRARKAISYFFLATKEHDIAERLEDAGKTKESAVHWKKAEKALEKHFHLLVGK